MMELDPILEAVTRDNASDVYLIEGTPPTLRVDGVATPITGAALLRRDDLTQMLNTILSGHQREQFQASGEANVSFVHPKSGRFRVNCYRALGSAGIVLRRVRTDIPSFEELDLPRNIGELALERRGLVLLVGATGTGKSTSVAVMLEYRNAREPGHIVTIEDPVEFIHERQKSVISQREVGIDTESYLVALQNALRQAPDVIFVGELRDKETVAVALHSAETGHLVLSTLHATNCTGAVERVLDFFPREARESALLQLSLELKAVVAQRLIPRADGKGRIAALEIMLNTPRIQAQIRRGELENLRQAIEEGTNEGLHTFDQHLLTLLQQKKVTQETALEFADSPNNLRLRIRGIR